MAKLDVQIWSDIACPWCYVGKRRLEAALAAFPHRDEVAVTWRAFELDPSAPRTNAAAGTNAERLAKKYGMTVAQAEERTRSLKALAAEDGLDLRFDLLRSGNTFDAHRLVHMAGERGLQDAMKERLLRAYMTEGESLGDVEVLVRLAGEVGIDAEDARAMLASDAYAKDVRADESEARALGINGVPFFVIGPYGVSGAQPAETLRRILERAWAEKPAAVEGVSDEGAACGVDGCA